MSRSVLLALLVLVPACGGVRLVHPDLHAAGVREGLTYKRWTHSLFWGTVPVRPLPTDGDCGEAGVLRIHAKVGPLGTLAQIATLGIWTPSRVKVTCADPYAVAPRDLGPPQYAPPVTYAPAPPPPVTYAPAPPPPPVTQAPPAPLAVPQVGLAGTMVVDETLGRPVVVTPAPPPPEAPVVVIQPDGTRIEVRPQP